MGDKLGLGVPGVSGLTLSRAASLILDENPYVAEKARSVLGWSPPYSMEDTMDRVGSWLKERGMIQ